MQRRSFLKTLAAMPLIGPAVLAAEPAEPAGPPLSFRGVPLKWLPPVESDPHEQHYRAATADEALSFIELRSDQAFKEWSDFLEHAIWSGPWSKQ